jgi:hypothetical protein
MCFVLKCSKNALLRCYSIFKALEGIIYLDFFSASKNPS